MHQNINSVFTVGLSDKVLAFPFESTIQQSRPGTKAAEISGNLLGNKHF